MSTFALRMLLPVAAALTIGVAACTANAGTPEHSVPVTSQSDSPTVSEPPSATGECTDTEPAPTPPAPRPNGRSPRAV